MPCRSFDIANSTIASRAMRYLFLGLVLGGLEFGELGLLLRWHVLRDGVSIVSKTWKSHRRSTCHVAFTSEEATNRPGDVKRWCHLDSHYSLCTLNEKHSQTRPLLIGVLPLKPPLQSVINVPFTMVESIQSEKHQPKERRTDPESE